MQPDQAEAFRAALEGAGVDALRLVPDDPRPPGRDQRPARSSPTTCADERARRLVDREFNLSHSATLPRAQRDRGRALGRPTRPARLSVEDGLAQTLGLKLGDTLRFDIGGSAERGPHHQPAQGRLGLDAGQLLRACSRPRRWSTLPVSYIAAFRAPPQRRASTTRLARDFPNITSIDVSASIAQIQRVLDQVVRAVEFLFGFTLAAGLVVLFAAVTRDARGARARVRGDARARRQRPAAGAGAARRAARRRRAGRRAGVAGGDGGRLGAGALRLRVQLERRRRWCRWPAASPARCWRWRPAGGACARCCAGRWSKRCARRQTSEVCHAARRSATAGILRAMPLPHPGPHAARPAPRGLRARPRSSRWRISRAAACGSQADAHRLRGRAFLEAPRDHSWDAVISDYNLPGFSGLVALELLKAQRPRRAVHPGLGRDRRGHRRRGDAQRRQRLPAEGQPGAAGAGAAARGRCRRDAARARARRPRAARVASSACASSRSTCRPASSTSARRSRARSTTTSAAR